MIYNISSKTFIDLKPLRIRLDIIDGFIRIYDGTRYLTLFGSKEYEAISNKSRYLISLKKASHVFFSLFCEIKVDSSDSLPIEKTLTFDNIIILIKYVLSR